MNPTVRRNPGDADLVVVGRVRTSGDEKTMMEGSFLGPAGETTGNMPGDSTGHRYGVQQRHTPYNKVGCWRRPPAAASVPTGPMLEEPGTG